MSQFIDGFVILATTVLALTSWPLAKLWNSRSSRTFLQTYASLLSLSIIVSVTFGGRILSKMLVTQSMDYKLLYWDDAEIPFWFFDSHLWSESFSLDNQWLLNVALFIPAGLVLTWVFGKATRVVISLLALSMAIEFIQRVFYLGAADPADIIANSIGSIVGVACLVPIRRA